MLKVPGFVQRPVSNHGGIDPRPLGLVFHSQEGNGSLYNQFNNRASESSSNVWLAKQQQHEQYLDLNQIPWTQADGNYTYASGEGEGFTYEPYTDHQLDGFARTFAEGVDAFGWKLQVTDTPGESGAICHGYPGPNGQFFPRPSWGNHACPGIIRSLQRPEVIRRAALILGTQPVDRNIMLKVPTIDIGKDVGHIGAIQSFVYLASVVNPGAKLSTSRTPAEAKKRTDALRYFQTVKGLVADGWFGPISAQALVEEAMGKKG